MPALPYRRIVLSAGFVFLLAGCGIQQVQPKTSPGATPATAPTTPPVPTVTVSGGSVAATVDGAKIPMSIFKAFLHSALHQERLNPTQITPPRQLAKSTIESLIQNQLILNAAARRGIVASPAAVHREVQSFIRQSRGKKAFALRLKQLGLPQKVVPYIARINVLGSKLRSKVAPLSSTGPVATARQILIMPAPTVSACPHKRLSSAQAHVFARRLVSEISSGKSFAQLARKCSDDRSSLGGSAQHGGMQQNPAVPGSTLLYPTGGFVPNFEKAVFSGPVNKLQLIHSRFGYHIVQVLSRRTGKYPPGVAAQVQAATFSTWLAHQRAQAKTHILESVK